MKKSILSIALFALMAAGAARAGNRSECFKHHHSGFVSVQSDLYFHFYWMLG